MFCRSERGCFMRIVRLDSAIFFSNNKLPPNAKTRRLNSPRPTRRRQCRSRIRSRIRPARRPMHRCSRTTPTAPPTCNTRRRSSSCATICRRRRRPSSRSCPTFTLPPRAAASRPATIRLGECEPCDRVHTEIGANFQVARTNGNKQRNCDQKSDLRRFAVSTRKTRQVGRAAQSIARHRARRHAAGADARLSAGRRRRREYAIRSADGRRLLLRAVGGGGDDGGGWRRWRCAAAARHAAARVSHESALCAAKRRRRDDAADAAGRRSAAVQRAAANDDE